MYNVLDISRYIINYSKNKEYSISNLKLQKILYFVQAYFLINSSKKEACFKERIEAWDFGPVIPEVYHEYKQYGSGEIPMIKNYIKIDKGDIWASKRVKYNDDNIMEIDKKMIKDVVDKFSLYSATDLVALTHKQLPWRVAYKPYLNNIISNDSIREYFNG